MGYPPIDVWTDTQSENITLPHPSDAGNNNEELPHISGHKFHVLNFSLIPYWQFQKMMEDNKKQDLLIEKLSTLMMNCDEAADDALISEGNKSSWCLTS